MITKLSTYFVLKLYVCGICRFQGWDRDDPELLLTVPGHHNWVGAHLYPYSRLSPQPPHTHSECKCLGRAARLQLQLDS